MANANFKRCMQAARRAARQGLNVKLVAPPVGSLRDAWMREYLRECERIKVTPRDHVGVCGINCRATRIDPTDSKGYCPHEDHWL